ncbi:hypothetical protein ACIRP2_06105 [Streptomyces sp. NPDC101194]
MPPPAHRLVVVSTPHVSMFGIAIPEMPSHELARPGGVAAAPVEAAAL